MNQVVWKRRVDEAALRGRTRRLLRWYVAPSSLVILGLWLLKGPWEALGLLSLLGLFGAMLGVWVWLLNLQARQNPQLHLNDAGQLYVHANRPRGRFDLNRVEAWTTVMREFRAVVYTPSAPKTGSVPSARLCFRMRVEDAEGRRVRRPDGGDAYEMQTLMWFQMSEDELVHLRAALEPHIAAPWVPPEQLGADALEG